MNTRSLTANRYYFGVFLNLAQHNAYLILNHIHQLLKKPANIEEKNLHKDAEAINLLKNANAKLEEKTQSLHLLLEHFPFLRAMIQVEASFSANYFDQAYFLLHSTLCRLNEERDFCSHFYKQNRVFNPIFHSPATELTPQITLEELRTRFMQFLGSEGTEQGKIALRKYPELNDKVLKEWKKYQLKLPFFKLNEPRALTEAGLIFLMSFFLTKEQTNFFISKISGLKDTRTARERMVRAMFTHFNCHLPQPKLESADVLLDMLNELKKCPKDLFDLLSEEDKERAELKKWIDEGAKVQTTNEEGELKRIEEFKRNSKENRFYYLALRYFDETQSFKSLRFQQYLGKLIQQKYQKPLQGNLEDRLILKEIHAFGRLGEFQKEYLQHSYHWDIYAPNTSSELEDIEKAEAGQIVQFSPHYHISRNTIGFQLKPSSPALHIHKTHNQKGKEIFTVENPIPDVLMSVYELPQMFLYQYLNPQFEILDMDDKNGLGNTIMKNAFNEFRNITNDKSLIGELNSFMFKDKKIRYQATLKEVKNAILSGKSMNDIRNIVDDVQLLFDQYSPTEYFIYQYCQNFTQMLNDVKNKVLLPLETHPTIQKKSTNQKQQKRILKDKNSPYKQEEVNLREERKNKLQIELDKRYKGFIHHSFLPESILEYLLGIQAQGYLEEVKNKFKSLKTENAKLLREVKKSKKNIKKILKTRKIAWRKAKNKFNSIQVENVKLLREGNKKKQKETLKGKKIVWSKAKNKFNSLKAGKIASWLAMDICYWKPYTNKNLKNGKPNNDQYTRLQAMLAYYPIYKDELPQYFKELNLISNYNDNQVHPFLKNVQSSHNLLGFYKNYLEIRKEHLTRIYSKEIEVYDRKTKKKTSVLSNEQIQEKYGHLFSFSLPPKTALEKEYFPDGKMLPVMLPKGVFNRKIIEGFKQLDSNVQETDKPIFALQTYLRKDTQNFYEYERNYKATRKLIEFQNIDIKVLENQLKNINQRNELFEKIENNYLILFDKEKRKLDALSKDDENRKVKKEKSEKFLKEKGEFWLNEFRKDILEKEKNIRFEQFQDRCLWLMSKELAKFRAVHKGGIELSLENATLQDLKKVLDIEKELSVKIEKVGAVKQTLKIRDYGNLRKFAKDRRLSPLFKEYFFNQTLEREILEEALKKLDVCKEEVLKVVFDFEEAVHSKMESEFRTFHNELEGEYLKHDKYVNFVKQKLNFELLPNFPKSAEIIMYRNKIIHNQIPENSGYLKTTLQGIASPLELIEKMIAEIIAIYQQLTQRILA
jgi:hypothetical protein